MMRTRGCEEPLTDLERNIRRFDQAAQSDAFLRSLQASGLTRVNAEEGQRLLRCCSRYLGRRPRSITAALEIGCGNGYLSANLKKVGAIQKSSVGLDVALEYLKLYTSKGAAGEVQLVVGDANRLPFRPAFDLVMGRAILHHLPELQPVFDGIRQALLPEGGEVFFLAEPHPIGSPPFRRVKRRYGNLISAIRQRVGKKPSSAHGSVETETQTFNWTPAQIQQAASQAGFQECRIGDHGLLESYLAAMCGPWLRGFGWTGLHLFARGLIQTAAWLDHRVLRHTPFWRWRTGLYVYLRAGKGIDSHE